MYVLRCRSRKAADLRFIDGALAVPLELNEEEWKEYIHALELFNSKYFWECHEVLEGIWLLKQAPLKTFLQGIIQAAAAFYHVLGENPKGTIKLAQDSLNKFENFKDLHLGLNVADLKKSLAYFRNEAQEMVDQKRELFSLNATPLLAIPEVRQ